MRRLLPLLFAPLLAIGASAADTRGAAWQPPLGIPAPSFGIREQAPEPPVRWDTPSAGFYYVAPGNRRATDEDNPYGTPRTPRASIPSRLPAGSLVLLDGVYDRAHTSPRGIVAEGTASRPVFIRSANAKQPAAIVQPWELSGSYVVVEDVKFRARDRRTVGTLVLLAPLQFAAVRHSDFSGSLDAGGLGVESWRGGVAVNDVVIWNNKVHDNGNVKASYDQDRHGIHVGERVSRVWVVDNEMWGNSGDGIQISAGSRAAQAGTHHIYVGRNVSHHNKQNGFWTKQAVDVVFSQNTSYGNRPGNSSPGAGLGFQYAPDYVWFLFNHVYESDYGIATGSDSDLGTGTESFFIGNLIHDIRDSNGDFNPDTAWHNCAISLPGGVNRYVVNNTIVNADSGVCVPSPFGKAEIHNNLVFNVRRDGQHVFLEFFKSAAGTRANGNVFGPDYRALTAGNQQWYRGEPVLVRSGPNSVVQAPMFTTTSGIAYDLAATAHAVDAGIDDPVGVYAKFQQRYGIDIRRDFLGRPRPSGAAWDAGAFERPAGSRPPAAGRR